MEMKNFPLHLHSGLRMIQMQAEKRLCNRDSLLREKGAFTRLITEWSAAEGMANYVTYVLHSCTE